ncbi:MAG: glycosyltransferase family 1 protein [Planctomycetales bacterium]|nr:glycosyltransferase family 1 protein [Planctomycetales bacterium]
MRIGVYLSRPPAASGGAATFEGNVVRALQNKADSLGWELRRFAADTGATSDEEVVVADDASYTVFRSDSKRTLRPTLRERCRLWGPRVPDSPLSERIAGWATKSGLDLIYSPSPFAPCLHVPFFVTVWDLQHRRQPFFPEVSVAGFSWQDRESMYLQTLPRAAGIITGTSAGKDEVVKFYCIADERVIVIPQATPEDAVPTANSGAVGAVEPFPYAIYPAQFWPHKNHVTLLRSWKLLESRGQDQLHLIFTGSDHGNEAYVRQICDDLGLQGRVHFRGFVSREELLQLYRNAKMLVFPSLFGPDNIPPLEAMALRCPVIAARVPGAEEQLQDGVILVDGTNEEQFADAITKLMENSWLAQRLTERGAEIAATRSVHQYAESLCIAFNEFYRLRQTWSQQQKYVYP